MLKKVISMILSIALIFSLTTTSFAISNMNSVKETVNYNGTSYTITTTVQINGVRSVNVVSSDGENITSTFYPLDNKLIINSNGQVDTYFLTSTDSLDFIDPPNLNATSGDYESYEYISSTDDAFFHSYGYTKLRNLATRDIEYRASHDGSLDDFIKDDPYVWVGDVNGINTTYDKIVGSAVIGTGLMGAILGVGLIVMTSGVAAVVAAVGAVYGVLNGMELGYVMDLANYYSELSTMWENR